jgi:hypothetical protein
MLREIRAMLGDVSPQRASEIVARKTFPEPLATVSAGRIWRREDVARWIAVHRPHQGQGD